MRGMAQLRLGDIGHSAASLDLAVMRSAMARDDEARGDRRAVEMQDGDEARRIDGAFIDHQLAHLGVAVLFDHENLVMGVDEIHHLIGEGEGAQRASCPDAGPGAPAPPALRSSPARSSRNRSRRNLALSFALARTGAGTSALGGFEFAQQPLHLVLIDRAFLAVFGEAVAAGAAGEDRRPWWDGCRAGCG